MISTGESEEVECGFVAGALVQTASGPVPIELIEAGDLVLSLPETGSELTYKRVVSTVVHQQKEVILVSYIVHDEARARHLVVTGNYPFVVMDKGLLRADRMTQGEFLRHREGRETYVFLARALFNADREGFGWTCHPGFGKGTEIDFRSRHFEIVSERSSNGEDSGAWGLVTQDVYNIEIDSPGGICVGDVIVRVPSRHPK